MNHKLLAELFRSAGAYHRALARYAGTMRAGKDVEHEVQDVLGASLAYRRAIERFVDEADPKTLRIAASDQRLRCMRDMLANSSRQYNLRKR